MTYSQKKRLCVSKSRDGLRRFVPPIFANQDANFSEGILFSGMGAGATSLLRQGLLGPERLRYRSFHTEHRPKKWGIRTLSISTCELARENFHQAYRSFLEICTEVRRKWKLGDLHLKLPPGGFIPPRAPLASLLPLDEMG